MLTVDYSMVSYRLVGLTADSCMNCVASLSAEVGKLPGVISVDLYPEQSRVNILTDGSVPTEWVADAIEDAGCDLIVDRVSHRPGFVDRSSQLRSAI